MGCIRKVVCLAGLAAALLAQQERRMPGITGTVVDPSGASVPGAIVMLRGGAEARQERTITDGEGSFRFAPVSQGNYELEVRHKQFRTVVVRVSAGGKAGSPLRIMIHLAGLRHEVTVEGQSERVSTSTADNLNVIRMDRSLLEALPVLDQDIIGAVSQYLDAGMTGSAGYSLVVDGMETSSLGVTASAIREVKINKNPYSAEFFSPGRGRIEVSTVEGAPKYHGSALFSFRDHRLYARNAFAAGRPPEQRRIWEGHLTGPLGRGGKTSFLLSAERKEDDEWALVYAQTPAGLLVAQAPRPERDTEISFRINRKPGDKRSYSLRYEVQRDSLRGEGVGGFSLPELGADSLEREHGVYFSHRSLTRRNVLNELQLRVRREDDRTRSRQAGVPKIVVHDAFTSGGAQDDSHSRDYRLEFGDVVSWTRGRHFLKAGFSVRDLDRRAYSDRSDRDGTFYFSSLEDYAAGKPYAFMQQVGDGGVVYWKGEMGGFIQDEFRLRSNLSLGLGLRYDWHRYPADHANFAPRASFAYAPGSRSKTVIRGGAGVFYDRMGSGPPRDVLLHDGARLRRILVSFPGYPSALAPGADLRLEPANIVRFDPRLVTPRLVNYSIGFERQLMAKTTLAVAYSGAAGERMFCSRDLNAPIPPDYLRPNPSIGVLRQIESAGRMEAHGIEVTLRGKLSRFFDGGILYGLGRACDDTDGIDSMPADSLDLSREWSRAKHDRRQRLRSFGVLNFGKLFRLGLVVALESGRPYSLTTGRDNNRDGRANDRPAGVRRNSLEGPGSATVDLRWSREFAWKAPGKSEEGPSVTFALDAFNALNRVNYAGFVGNMSSPFFGEAVAARSPRRLQLSLRFKF